MVDHQVQDSSASVSFDPAFEQGRREGREGFHDVFGEDQVPTVGEIVKTIELHLSSRSIAREQALLQAMQMEPIPYSYRLGFIEGWMEAFVARALRLRARRE